jgi:hypothetical protein
MNKIYNNYYIYIKNIYPFIILLDEYKNEDNISNKIADEII